ncbi:MAG: type IV secretory system conjugative DNA transfer family protein [Solirubrobacteraceae bacterium]|nr:type IV secretory system conjugative DNA transfer family protein [Solirubrobacteraceae bacterium]
MRTWHWTRVALDSFATRGGVLGPDSRPPHNMSGYYDYRGTATLRELPRLGAHDLFPLGRFVNPRTGRRKREIGLAPGDIATHALAVGPTGSGKTTSLVVPWAAAALDAGYATIVADVTGALVPKIGAELIASGVSGVSAARIDYRHPTPDGWAFVRELSDERRLSAAAQALIGRERPGDPQPFFWQRDTRLMTGLLATAHASRRPVTARELLAAVHDQRALRAYVSAYGTPRAQVLLSDALAADPFDYSKITSGVVNALEPLAVPQVDAITGNDRVRIDDALSGSGLVAFGAPLGDGRLGESFAALFLNLLIERVHARHGGSAYPAILIIDEAARLADRVDFELLLSTSRAAGVSVVLAAQDIAQFPEGRVRDGVLANCQTLITMPGVGATTAQKVSERLGTRPEIEIDHHRQTNHFFASAVNRRHQRVPVLDTREIFEPPFGPQCAVVHSRPLSPKPFVVDLSRSGL